MNMFMWWLLHTLQLIGITASYHLYSMVNPSTDTTYDCIYAYYGSDFFENILQLTRLIFNLQPAEQIISFCVVQNHTHSSDTLSWSFEQMSKEGITSNDLVLWNAQINIINDYEYYLLTNNEQLRYSQFYNCSNTASFGSQCQYSFEDAHISFENLLSNHFTNLPIITEPEAGMMEDADFTCYKRDTMCHGGCLDWGQICNGIIDCIHREDEAWCDLLEFNECDVDEYRCRSGHCIPLMSAFDIMPDCIDGSDERPFDVIFNSERCYQTTPHMFCDDSNDAWMNFPCGDGYFVENPQIYCNNHRYIRTLKEWYADDGTLCWKYMMCSQVFEYLFPTMIDCDQICTDKSDCWSMISMLCPNSTLFFPPNSIMASPNVYLAYNTSREITSILPDFICYTECDHLYPPSMKLHGYSCRTFIEFNTGPFYLAGAFFELFTNIIRLFAGCNNKVSIKQSASKIFHCPLTNQTISSHRIKDKLSDCYLSSDETYNESICALNLTQRFQCWTRPSECIPIRYVQNYGDECSDRSDEFYSHECISGTEKICDYKRGIYQPTNVYYEFQRLCDGVNDEPSLIKLLNGTDETDCDHAWCLLTSRTRCNDFWDCTDGRDELNCSAEESTDQKKSSLALHSIYGCSMLEHFCIPSPDLFNVTSRWCLPISRAGDDRIDCWGATDERTKFCNYTSFVPENMHRYPCAGNSNVCIDVKKICNGQIDCPLEDDEKLCDWLPINDDVRLFYCRNGSVIRRIRLCDGRIDCSHGEDEWFCDLKHRRHVLSIVHTFDEISYPTYPVEILKSSEISQRHFQMTFSSLLYVTASWYCNRGMPILDRDQRRCLCSPSYFGEHCENQQSRISIFLKIISFASFPREIAIKLVLYLIDITSLKILVDEEVLHLPYIHSTYRHLSLLSSIYANNSFVRIDAYEVSQQQVIGYKLSWKFDVPFSFLPVRRLTVRLTLPDEENVVSRQRVGCHSCIHGDCLSYENSEDKFCRCHNGWTGINCNISFICAISAQSLNSHRCLCPLNRHGTRCFVPNIIECQCQNGGTCISLDARVGQNGCFCNANFFGKYCEKIHANLTIKLNSVDHPEFLPIVLVQLAGVTKRDDAPFENIFMSEHVHTYQPLTVYHVGYETLPLMVLCKIFYSSSIDHYAYYLVLYLPYIYYKENGYPTSVQTQLEPKQRCPHIREMEIFKSPIDILSYPYIKRIKFYILGRSSSNNTRCFHDEVYMCFCHEDRNKLPSCITYDHTQEVCKKPNYCLNEGLCVENRRSGIIQFSCLCPKCSYYGSLCQFSIGHQGLSLDALVGTEMRTGKSLSDQSPVIKISLAVVICVNLVGFIGNSISLMTLVRKKSRQAGCGWYLILMSISNQCTLFVFALRFIYLLATQIIIWKNRDGSLILCQILELLLTVLSNLSNWLTAFVSIERTITVARGALFDKAKSVRIAKWICLILPWVFIAMAVHEPITRSLIEDPRLGRYTWCVIKYDSAMTRTTAIFFSIVHLVGPFFINFVSTGFLIFTVSRQRTTVQKNKTQRTFTTVLREQISFYKHLIISSIVLLILTLPRLVISLGSLCIDTSWHNYMFLIGYFISFIPLVTTLFIFVSPSPLYSDELKLSFVNIHHWCFHSRNHQ